MVMDEPSSVTKVYYVYFNGHHCPYYRTFPDFPVLAFRALSWNSFQINFWKPGRFIAVGCGLKRACADWNPA
jgi:hypothetical protein